MNYSKVKRGIDILVSLALLLIFAPIMAVSYTHLTLPTIYSV